MGPTEMGPERKPAKQSGHSTGSRVASPRRVELIAEDVNNSATRRAPVTKAARPPGQ